ncbi:TPA: VWA domain-containing protein, partial [Klebsiella pneumoniae]
MRRLPVFFVLDCSESMIGENLKRMNDGLQKIVSDLRKDPHALETVWVSVIAFAGIARTIVPLHDIVSFYPPRLPVGGGTNLATALRELTTQIDSQVRKTTLEEKGDWKPVVYLLTDGRPTDDISAEVKRWNEFYAKKVNMIAVGIGPSVDLSVLRQLTENVLSFTENQEGDFSRFIQWITASVTAHSRSVGEDSQPPLKQTDYIGHCCKVSDEAAFCLIQRPYISKTLLTRRISPRGS